MNEINQQLKQLALEAQQHPAKTKQRQQALTKLLKAIQQSGQLMRPRSGEFQVVRTFGQTQATRTRGSYTLVVAA